MSELPHRLNGQGLARQYARLEPAERFRLVLEAGARDDGRERERLVSSAPMRTYWISDPAYIDRVGASRELALAVALELGPRLSQLRFARATREALPHAVALGVECGAGAAGDEHPRSEGVREVVDQALGEALGDVEAGLRSQAAAVLAAFGECCRQEMGLEPEVVLSAHLGPQLAFDELDGVKPDKGALRAWRELFARTWRERVGP